MSEPLKIPAGRFYTTGKICEHLQRPIGHIEAAITALEIVPCFWLNDLAYYSTEHENLIYEHYRTRAIKELENAKRK